MWWKTDRSCVSPNKSKSPLKVTSFPLELHTGLVSGCIRSSLQEGLEPTSLGPSSKFFQIRTEKLHGQYEQIYVGPKNNIKLKSTLLFFNWLYSSTNQRKNASAFFINLIYLHDLLLRLENILDTYVCTYPAFASALLYPIVLYCQVAER